NANKASFQNDLDTFKSDLSLSQSKKIADSNGEHNITTENIAISDTNTPATFKEFIPSINEKYAKILGINRGKLIIGRTATVEQISWAEEVGISGLPKIDILVGENITFDGGLASATNPVIPKDFAPINEGGANWGEKDATNKGLVIQDTDANQFVWIPVPKFEQFLRTDDYKLNGLTISQCIELKPTELGATQELKDMYKSVETNKGFYIARYEAGNTNGSATDGTVKPVSQKDATVWNNIPWGTNSSDITPGNGAVTVSRKMYAADAAGASTLMYGVQYDAVLRFIKESRGKTTAQIQDSCNWGNHSNNLDRESVIPNNPAVSGALDSWSTNNIYDLAGNVWELTMEVYWIQRVVRSGSYYDSSRYHSVFERYNYSAEDTRTDIGFRVALYVK
ncbi:MAG: hypothetical protein RSG48_06990, partial [Clostridia bacterium]